MDSHTARATFAGKWERMAAPTGSPSGVPGGTVGSFTLRPAQLRAVDRIRAAFDEFGGALLADPPGTGKTIIALAVARALRDAPLAVATTLHQTPLVLAPSALRSHWERAAQRARVTITFVSLETMSRGAAAAPAGLVIVDEAHHVRTPSTRRYAGVAAACAGARVLLLTATPVVNRRGDRDALLALFLGAAAATLDAESAARCIVRRTVDEDDPGASRPRLHRLPPLDVPLDGGPASVADALVRLPPPFPSVDGAPAVALVRISLAMAWSSSLAALDAALRRRVQRGEALADSLAAGRWPTRATLRQWIVGDDATQLAFSELEPAHDRVPGDALAVLRTHLAAVRALRATIGPSIAADAAARADALRALLRAHPTSRMVVFANHVATVRALWTAMRADAGVVAVTGACHGGTVRAAAGRWQREDVLRALGPDASPLPARADDPARRDAIRVLLATDLLSEGIELQGVRILVHADRPWTPARLEQREGRITRLTTRAPAGTVFVTRFRAPPASAPLLRLDARLRRKQRTRSRAVSDAEAWEEVDVTIRDWKRGDDRAQSCFTPAFLALVRVNATVGLVSGRRIGLAQPDGRTAGDRTAVHQPDRRWRVSSKPHSILSTVRLGLSLGGPSPNESREVRTALARWARRSAANRLLGGARDARSPLRRRLHECVDRLLRATPLALRARRGAELEALALAVSAVAGAGVERALSRLLRQEHSDEAIEEGLRSLASADHRRAPAPSRCTLVALLVTRAVARPHQAPSHGPP